MIELNLLRFIVILLFCLASELFLGLTELFHPYKELLEELLLRCRSPPFSVLIWLELLYFEPQFLDKTLLISHEKVNKNYSLRLKRLYGRRILENHEYSKKHCTLFCPRNRQAEPPRINRKTAKEWRFLLKSNNEISLSLYVIPLRRKCFLKTSLLNQQMLLGIWEDCDFEG